MISLPMMIQFLVIGINTAVTLFGLIFYVEANQITLYRYVSASYCILIYYV